MLPIGAARARVVALTTAVAVALAAGGITRPAHAVINETLTLSPSSGPKGTTFHLIGDNWIAGQTVSFTWDGAALATNPSPVVVANDGHFDVTAVAPNSAAAGPHTVRGTDPLGDDKSATFTVTATGTTTTTTTAPATTTTTRASTTTTSGGGGGATTTTAKGATTTTTKTTAPSGPTTTVAGGGLPDDSEVLGASLGDTTTTMLTGDDGAAIGRPFPAVGNSSGCGWCWTAVAMTMAGVAVAGVVVSQRSKQRKRRRRRRY